MANLNVAEDRIRALAHALVYNEVDVCGVAMFRGLETAKEVLKTLNEGGYDISPIEKWPIKDKKS